MKANFTRTFPSVERIVLEKLRSMLNVSIVTGHRLDHRRASMALLHHRFLSAWLRQDIERLVAALRILH